MTGRGGFGDIVLERPGPAAEGSFHAVGDLSAPAVSDGHQDAGEQPRDRPMDVLSDLLHRARAGNATIRQLIQRPPWSLTFADAPPLTIVATLGGHASVRLDEADAAPVRLSAGDLALISGTGRHTIADDPSTPPQVVLYQGRKHLLDGSEVPPGPSGDWLPAPTATVCPGRRP
ncbi:cupin domain-containing protein [Nonomuraea sp. NPDC049158]|uniref:cupin domain-containing protein n=1 Tax=Nonomuraea sp. NPDC049158 TaxID=3155649 RepID=UPI0033FE947A